MRLKYCPTSIISSACNVIPKGPPANLFPCRRVHTRRASGCPFDYLKDVRNGSSVVCCGSKYECPRTNAFSSEKALQKTSVTCYLKDIRKGCSSGTPTGQKSSAVVRRNTFFHPSQSRVSWRMSTTISVLESSVAGATTDDHWISWCEALIFIVRVGYPTVLLLITHLGDRYCARLSSVSEGIQLSFWLSVQRAKDLNIN